LLPVCETAEAKSVNLFDGRQAKMQPNNPEAPGPERVNQNYQAVSWTYNPCKEPLNFSSAYETFCQNCDEAMAFNYGDLNWSCHAVWLPFHGPSQV
jgi:hypothetical protein